MSRKNSEEIINEDGDDIDDASYLKRLQVLPYPTPYSSPCKYGRMPDSLPVDDNQWQVR